MFGRRHSLVRRIGAVIVAMLWVQVILAANPECSTTSPQPGATHHSVDLAHSGHSGHSRHAPAPASATPDQHGPQQCLMTLACAVAVAAAPSTDDVPVTTHRLVVPASITAPASAAGALEPPPPRA